MNNQIIINNQKFVDKINYCACIYFYW